MTKRSYANAKGRRESGPFIPIPVSVIRHPNYRNLNGSALRLLLDLCSQVRFKTGGSVNNGDLTAAMTILKELGWTSNESIDYGLKELLYYRFITITRRGGRNKCHLYAVTWWAIDNCKDKLDVKPTTVARNEWKEVKPKWKRPKRKLKSLHRNCSNITPLHGATT